MKKLTVYFLLFVYNNLFKRNLLRILIKKVLGTNRLKIGFSDFKIMASTASAIESNVMFNEYNEMGVLSLIKKYTAAGYNFVDIGANIGLHSLTAAKSNSAIDIYSFEPETENYQHFLTNIVLNDFMNIRPFKMGVGNVPAINTLNINEGWNKGKHSLKMKFESSGKTTQVPVINLDSFKNNINYEFLLIKIDVEGFEQEVIDGASEVFEQTPNIILIIELISQINGYENCEAISKSLTKRNFNQVFKIDQHNRFEKVDRFNGSSDYVFIKGKDAFDKFES